MHVHATSVRQASLQPWGEFHTSTSSACMQHGEQTEQGWLSAPRLLGRCLLRIQTHLTKIRLCPQGSDSWTFDVVVTHVRAGVQNLTVAPSRAHTLTDYSLAMAMTSGGGSRACITISSTTHYVEGAPAGLAEHYRATLLRIHSCNTISSLTLVHCRMQLWLLHLSKLYSDGV